jgi:hypothetical protein
LAGKPILFLPILATFIIWTPAGFLMFGVALAKAGQERWGSGRAGLPPR